MPKDPVQRRRDRHLDVLAGNMGPRISEKMDGYAKKAGMSRRNFLKSSLGFSAAMLAANEVTGMKFFEVGEAEAADVERQERSHSARAREQRLHRRRPHARLHAAGPLRRRRQNTTTRGMWFVQLLDDLGKAMGLPNGTARHDGRELRQADPQGERHHRRHLQPVRLPRGLRRPGHDPDGLSGPGARELAEVHAHAGRRPDAEPGPERDARPAQHVRRRSTRSRASSCTPSTPPRRRAGGSTTRSSPTRSGKSAASSASRTSAATRAFRSVSSTRAMRTPRTSTRPRTTSST